MLVPRGSIVPLPTPFTGADSRIDEQSLGDLIEFQLANGSIASLAYVAAPANVSAVITPIDPATVITLPNA